MANNDPLNAFRRRLLDLTRRNPLLNYRHPRQRSLRIVDELPDQLFSELYDGAVFTLVPVPEPPKYQDADNETRDMFTERAGQRQKPDVGVWARHKGIRTEYELPKTASNQDARHRNKKIQTLFYPEELEAQLGNISRLAKTAMDESGVNILYLAFGFLEWLGRDGADPSLAPLLLLPVTISKTDIDPRTRRYKYEIKYSEEDFEANISLREMLKLNFNIDLPSLDEEDTPESYLKKCEPMLRAQPEWKLRRYVTLGFFQFGKLLLYLDLDPANWPAGHELANHPIIKRILAGDVKGEIGDAPLHPIDDLKPTAPEFQLIQEADSSQHSAIVDAAAGEHMVIEGPPGTGKSQTITNIIAVALNQGKSVLFVAEKLAALKVVKDRLDKAGLGVFCLELHSNRANKKLFYEDLRKRRDFRIDATRQATLATKVADLQKTRQALNTYAELVGRKIEGLDITYSDLFGRCASLQSAAPKGILKVETLKCDAGIPLDRDWLATADSRVARAETVRADIVRTYESVEAHPWSWLAPKTSPGEHSPPADETGQWLTTLLKLRDVTSPLRDADIDPLGLTPRQLAEVARLQSELVPPKDLPLGPLSRMLVDADAVVKLTAHAAREEALSVSHSRVVACYDATHVADPAWFPAVVKAAKSINDAPIPLIGLSVAAVIESRDAILAYVAAQPDIAAAVADVQRHFTMKVASGADVIKACAAILSASRTLPYAGALAHRFAGLEQVTDIKAVESIKTEIDALKNEQSRNSLLFNVSPGDDLGRLSAAAEVLQRGGFFSFFDGGWRSANEVYKEVSRARSWFKSSQKKGQELANLATFQTRLQVFEANPQHAALLGKGFRGLATPVPEYVALIKWFEEVKSVVGQHGAHTTVSLALAHLPKDKLEPLQKLAGGPQAPIFERALVLLATLRRCMSPTAAQTVVGDPSASAPAEKWIGAISEAIDVFTGGMQKTDQPIAGVVSMLSDYGKHASDHERIGGRESLGLEQNPAIPLEGSRKAALEALMRWSSVLWSAPVGALLRKFYCEAIKQNGVPSAYTAMNELGPCTQEEGLANDALRAKFHLFRGHADPDGIGRDVHVGVAIVRLSNALENVDQWDGWVTYTDAVHSICAHDSSLIPLARAYHRNEINADQLRTGAHFLLFNTHGKMIAREHQVFQHFSTLTHEGLRKKFGELDAQVCVLHRELIASKLSARRPPRGRPGPRVMDMTEMALLDQQMSLQRPRMSMRQVMAKSGAALQVLKSCFMMGPLSVAQFLKPGSNHFDIIVMDEASQMKPEDALGAVARGTQLIVVGDPKQLPPTTFFDKLNADDGTTSEDDAAVGDQESILQMVTPLFAPTRMLKWHYRSKHESLIAFSNHQFYGDKLLLFPTALPKTEGLGIQYQYVEGGAFRAGVNEREAAEVVRGAMREIRRTGGTQTIAIVAMNVEQMNAIQREWDKQLRQMEDLRGIVDKLEARDEEPFIIKNLENIQGDERDIIVISMTYGPDMDGNFHQRFGPINQQDGWRRLNVLFTRARQKMAVYSSMHSAQVVPGPQSGGGPAALRGFLEYCERGVLVSAPVHTDRPPANEFEDQVIAIVKDAGFGAEPQVGVCGYFVDIGVTHPAVPGRFLLGIECDGAPYHSSRFARDRDKLREQVLVSMGWTIHRIWSPDWFSRTAPERQRLVAVLDRLRETLPAMPAIVVERRSTTRDPDALRSKLHGLKRMLEESNPDVPSVKRLLRNDVLELLIKHRPTSRDEFSRAIPEAMRLQTDTGEAAGHLETVLTIIDDHG